MRVSEDLVFFSYEGIMYIDVLSNSYDFYQHFNFESL